MQKSYKILNEGEVGYGILVEKDAGETLEINKNTNFLKENEGSEDSVVRILIDCILQKAGVKNRNGRIYPKEVLVREVEKYKALIEANNSFGECVDGETEILTTNGWKFIKDIADDEQIYTLNVETNQLTVETIKNKLVKDYNGVMYHIYNNNSIDMMLTPNHNMLIYDRYGKPYALYTEEFVKKYRDEIISIDDINFLSENNEMVKADLLTFIVGVNNNYNNKVYCVTTENGTWLMRRNGKIAWTKNCDHPDSPTISLKKDVLSHLVRSVRWDGDTLYGTIEIITSKGYHQNGGIYCVGDHIANLLERGYKLGISSRGLGSLKKIGKDNYVQNDFELLGWDLVSSPSTPDAYLFQQSKTITESVNPENILNENEKKFKNFLDFSKKLL
jgi:hypothetical protein